jgi:hypothetical protein
MNGEAEALFTKIFLNLTIRRSEIHSFRKVVELGLPRANAVLAADNLQWARRMLSDPEYDGVFLDKAEFLRQAGGVTGLGSALTSNQLSVFGLSVDAASLVFMHSALDAAIQDLCRVCALVAPSDWEQFLGERKVALSDLKSSDYMTIFHQRLTQYLADLERESLLKKVDRIFQLCQPPQGFARAGYSFDRNRLDKLDRDRHAIIHGDGAVRTEVEQALEYLLNTGLFLFEMVNRRYGVKMDPVSLAEGYGWGKLSNRPLQSTRGSEGPG